MPHTRKRRVVLGGVKAVKLGVPSAFADLYYSTMEMSWPAFVGVVSLAFLFINLAFGLVYAALPGAIAKMAPGSLVDGFFFSVDTLGTVGYGSMSPATHAGHAVAAVEILIGLFFSATITGLIFARFARPRDGFVFSRYAVIGEWEGRRALMVRLSTVRVRAVADVTAQISWLQKQEQPDGRVFRRLIELPLVRATNPMFALSWTLVHLLDDGSPMLAALLDGDEFRLSVTVSGFDTLLASQAIGGTFYSRDQVLMDHEFVDAVQDRGGEFELDLRKLDAVMMRRPAAPGSTTIP